MRWIDSHVHLFSGAEPWGAPSLAGGKSAFDPAAYGEAFEFRPPEASVVVHFSKAPDASHVIAALDAMRMPARGIIAGGIEDRRVDEWLARDDVAGLRLYALEASPDFSDAAWEKRFAKMAAGRKHLLVFGKGGALSETLTKLPAGLPVVIDHLGIPDAAAGKDDAVFRALVAAATKRAANAPVYVKGPGYRTSLDPATAAPFVRAWADALGEDRILLGASDAPFFGPRPNGGTFGEVMNPRAVIEYLDRLADLAGFDAERVLYRNAASLYGFD